MAVGFNIPNGSFRLNAQEAGGQPDYMQALRAGMQGSREAAETVMKPQNLSEALLQAQLKNAHDRTINKYLPRSEEARIGATESNTALDPFRRAQMQANTGLTSENTYKQKILNAMLPEREKAEIAEATGRGEYYKAGGGNRGVGSKSETEFMNNIGLDNPNIPPEQMREVANAVRSGQATLPDGTPINVTPTTLESLNRVLKSGTTANLINQGVKANQGEAELDALDDYSSTLSNPYPSSIRLPGIGEFSPEQIKDSLNPSEAAQKRLGQSIGVQALNYEKAQVRNNIAGGMPGITAINELMAHSGQVVRNRAPHISSVAREEADRVISKGIQAMKKARIKVGFAPSALINRKGSKNNSSELTFNPATGRLE